MNRVKLHFLADKSSLRKNDLEELNKLNQPKPDQAQWKSQKFPIYPFIIDIHLSSPPFNKISFCIPEIYRTNMDIFGSLDGVEYHFIEQVNVQKDDFEDGQFVTKFFKQTQNWHYLRLKMQDPAHLKIQGNICRQVGLRALEVCNITFFNSKYLCSLQRRMQLHPCLFNLLQLLEYRYSLLSRNSVTPDRYNNNLKDKYAKRIAELETLIIYNKKVPNVAHPPSQLVEAAEKEFDQLLEEPLVDRQQEKLYTQDPVGLKHSIKELEHELSAFYVDRLSNLQKHVVEYFEKYWNVEIRDIYLRLLSSPEHEDHTRALTQFWSQVKELRDNNKSKEGGKGGGMPPNIEEATLMFLNFYMEARSMTTDTRTAALKVLCVFAKLPQTGFKLPHLYQRVLSNLLGGLGFDEDKEVDAIRYKCIFLLFQRMPNHVFLKQFLDSDTSPTRSLKLRKLEILEKITTNDPSFEIQNRVPVQQFIIDILLNKDITVAQKNRAYNVVAFLAASFGKETVLEGFEKLNSMILMNMEKVIDLKLERQLGQAEEGNMSKSRLGRQHSGMRSMCDHCGMQSTNFRDEKIYDLHLARECKMLMPCPHCQQVTEILELQKHYLEGCTLKNKFKSCENCTEVILIDAQKQHEQKCSRNFLTKCPLCGERLDSKLKIKQHLLKGSGCPNNPKDDHIEQGEGV